MEVDICICTHNPRIELLCTAISSIARQEVNPDRVRVLLIDNASKPELEKGLLTPLIERGIPCRHVQEPQVGLPRARIRAIQETSAEWVLFVDDDNELNPDYIERGLAFIQDHPDVGCFGGRILLPNSIQPASLALKFLPYLGIKDEGDKVIIGTGEEWGPAEPPGAGAWVHRKVLNEYLRRSQEDKRFFKLGRTGKRNLASCDDSLMMRGARDVGLKNAYVPDLVLKHHLDESRFRFRYLMRLMRAYGASHVVLETVLRGPRPIPEYYRSRKVFLKLLMWVLAGESRKSVYLAFGMVVYHCAARHEHLAQRSGVDFEQFA